MGSNRLHLLFILHSTFVWNGKKRYKMAFLRQGDIQFCRVTSRTHGGGFAALAQVIGRLAVPFLRKDAVLAAKRSASKNPGVTD